MNQTKNFDVLLKLNQSTFANIVFNVAQYECETLDDFENFLNKEVSEQNKEALQKSLSSLQSPLMD
ncbi:MAG: hypothetical protein PHG19_06710 [Anaerotignum sp.]|nr:hypothetical protein [Anaerotignum sp.]